MPEKKKKVIFLSLGEYRSDSRVYKQAHCLDQAGYQVLILAVWRKGLEKIEREGCVDIERVYFPVLKKLRFPFYKRKLLLPFYTLKALRRILTYKPGILQCERVHTIHIGLICKWFLGIKFVYDSREMAAYWPMMINAKWITRKLLIAYEKFVSKRAGFVIQTTESRANHFLMETGVNATIIMNKPLPPQNGRLIRPLAEKYHQANQKVVCYVGSIIPGRGIEHVAKAVSGLENVKFVLLGPLKRRGAEVVDKYSDVIECVDPVDPTLITSVLKGVDVGISLMQNICLSYYYSCPTKLWELIVAGVPQLGSDFPEYRKIVTENSIGPVGRLCDPDNPDEIRRELHLMLNSPKKLKEYHNNAIKLREQCVWESEGRKLVASYGRMFNNLTVKTIDVCCYNCGSDQRTYYAAENGYTMVKCSDCGLLYVTPRPTEQEIDQAHQHGIHRGKSKLRMTGSFKAVKVGVYKRILKEIYPTELTEKKLQWLDIGCGHGEFLIALDRVSSGQITASGLEPNGRKREAARRKGLDVSYFDIDTHNQKYDIISLLNVYSHLPDPPGFLKSCRNLLNPGGELLIQTGDAADLSADEMWRPMYLPDHLSFATEEIVMAILKRCGFEILTIRKYPSISMSLTSMAKELVKVGLPGKTSRLVYQLNPKYKSDKYKTSMYIRARAVK